MRAMIKQTVVRWVSCEVDPEWEPEEELMGEDLENFARELLYDTVQEDGWDGEDVLEESYEMTEDD
jgi:hypothetical protein